MWVPQEELLRAPAASSTDPVSAGFCARSCGLIFLALESRAGGPGLGLGLLAPQISLPNFYPRGCGTSLFRICAPPMSLDGCGFFNSVVVRLPFSSISDVPE